MFDRFKTRSLEPERLDLGDYTPEEYALWQKEMWYVHRFFGELRALRASVIASAGELDTRPAILDVAAGGGQLLEAVAAELSHKKPLLVGLELDEAAALSIKNAGLLSIRADASHLPFADDAFDIVFCTLFLHHLTDDAAAKILSEMARVARLKIVAIDLARAPVPYFLYKYVGRLFLQPFTIEDGALSILRSFTAEELAGVARGAGLTDVSVTASKMNRLILTAQKAR